MNNIAKRQCPVCGTTYDADLMRLKHGRQTTCSRSCSYKLRASKIQNGKEYTCPVCDKVFWRSIAQIKSRHGANCCSRECAYKVRKRIVDKPYVYVTVVDYAASTKKAWETRRANNKPYPESARKQAADRAIEKIKHGKGVSKFERKVADIFKSIGFNIICSSAIRNIDGTFATVFDIVIPSRMIVIECNGNFWHGGRWSWDNQTPSQAKNLVYEERKFAIAKEHGFDIRVVWEKEFKSDPIGACLTAVR